MKNDNEENRVEVKDEKINPNTLGHCKVQTIVIK